MTTDLDPLASGRLDFKVYIFLVGKMIFRSTSLREARPSITELMDFCLIFRSTRLHK